MKTSIILALVAFWLGPTPGPRLGADLRQGMQLIYTSNGRDQPWSIDSVELNLSLMAGADCARLHLKRQANQREPEESRLCVARDTLYGWNATRQVWVAQRPVGPQMELKQRRANGDTVVYTTGRITEEVIGPLRLAVIETVVTTVDSLGREKRRLRERYALTLATATGGRFEVPDSAGRGWRTEQAFELREIRFPE